MTRRRKMHLVVQPPLEKAWAAVTCISQLTGADWVSIDLLGDFLKMRQLDGQHANFNATAPGTRYALKPKFTAPGVTWDDSSIAHALKDCVEKQILRVKRDEKGHHFFKAVAKDEHAIWSVHDATTPYDDKWRGALPARR